MDSEILRYKSIEIPVSCLNIFVIRFFDPVKTNSNKVKHNSNLKNRRLQTSPHSCGKKKNFWCVHNLCLLFLFENFSSMKILAWNMEGFGNKYTRQHVRELIKANDPDIIFLSETKSMNSKMVRYTYTYNYMSYLYVNPIGASGGLFML